MKKLFYLVFCNILFSVFYLACKTDNVVPEFPEQPGIPCPEPDTPDYKDSILDTIVPPNTDQIAFLFRVRANITNTDTTFTDTTFVKSVSDSLSFLMWGDADSVLYAEYFIDSQQKCLKLLRDSLAEDNKTAWFSAILDFIPTEDVEWFLLKPAKTQDFSVQDGKFSTLSQYANLSGKTFGTSPVVYLNHDLCFVQVILPASVKSIECQDGFYCKMSLCTPSNEYDQVFFAIPQSLNTPFIISALNVANMVFRSVYVNKNYNNTSDNIIRVSMVEKTKLNAAPQKTYKSLLRGNFSGITRIEGSKYAIVSDASDSEGWYTFDIEINNKGEIESVSRQDYVMSYCPQRDLEDVVYNSSSNKMLLVAEDDNIITEHEISGERTGVTLPTFMFDGISANFGLESLTYNHITKRYWTTTEGGLECDGGCASAYRKFHRKNKLRLQSYLEDGSIGDFWFYDTDSLQKNIVGVAYAFGVSALCALNDGRLLVMERETLVNLEIGEVGFSCIKIYIVDPTISIPETILHKELLLEINNTLTLSLNPATFDGDCINYEGMCLGPILPDGSQTILLVSDSQDNMSLFQDGENYVFRDIFLSIVLHNNTDQ